MLAAQAIFTVAIRPAEPPCRPEGAGQRKAMRMPPPVCALGDRGRAQRAARRLQEAFSWSAHHQIAKQLGSPTPSQGEEGGVRETGVLLCFCASAPQSTAPVGLASGARPAHPLSTPRSLGSPRLLLALPWMAFWAKQHGMQGSEVQGLAETGAWEVAELGFILSTSCLQIPLWEPSTQRFLLDDLLCTRLWADGSLSLWSHNSSRGRGG